MKRLKLAKINCLVKYVSLLMLAYGVLMLSGCASVISGTHQNIEITSQPDMADVKVEQLLMTNNIVTWEGKTPTKVKLSRNGTYMVTVSLPNYQKAQIPVSGTGLNGLIFGNILIGGLVGVAVDCISGAIHSLQPGAINVNWADTNTPPVVTRPVIVPNKPISKTSKR